MGDAESRAGAAARSVAARVGKDRRKHPTTSDPRYVADQVEFMMAVDEYKRTTGRAFPTLCETLGVLLALGYRKEPPDRVEPHPGDP